MARQRGYRPYKTRGRTTRNSRIIIITLLIVLTGIIVFIRTRRNHSTAAQTDVPDVPYEEVLQDTPSAASNEPILREEVEPNSEPLRVPDEETVTTAAVPEETVSSQPVEPIMEPETQIDNSRVSSPVNSDADISPEAESLINQAIEERKAGRIIAARDLLNEALQMKLTPAVRQEVKVQMTKLSDQWLFNRNVLAGDMLTGLYKVMPGDVFSRIGLNHQVPHEILMDINGIRNDKSLQAGQTIKVINGPFHALVNLSTFTLDLYLQTTYVKSYKVGIGQGGRDTPTGTWRVKSGGKMIRPQWTDPDTGRLYRSDDPDYPLGSRWIALEGVEGDAKGRTGFALHGTKDPETIGTRSSRGCIRLYNGEIIELYNMLCEGKSLVKTVQ